MRVRCQARTAHWGSTGTRQIRAGEAGPISKGHPTGDRLGVGIIGLGRLWESRHRPTLANPHGAFRVAALVDQVARRARLEAQRLRCAAPSGPTELVLRDDVHAVYLLSPQWFGLYPAILARRLGKPVYCALPLAADPHGLAELATLPTDGPPFVPELPRRVYPATLRLRELLATTLGPPRLILGQAPMAAFDRLREPGPSTPLATLPLTTDPGASLLDWCANLFQAQPTRVSVHVSHGSSAHDFAGFVAEFPGPALARIEFLRDLASPGAEPPPFFPRPGFQVFAERGQAFVEPPDRIQWTGPEGPVQEHLPGGATLGEVLNNQFLRLLGGQTSAAPTLADALRLAELAGALERSRRDRTPVDL